MMKFILFGFLGLFGTPAHAGPNVMSMYCGSVKAIQVGSEEVEVDIILDAEGRETWKKYNGGGESKGTGHFFAKKKFDSAALIAAATVSIKDSGYKFCVPAGDGQKPWPKGLGRDFYSLIKN